jgi:hypothetical protein
MVTLNPALSAKFTVKGEVVFNPVVLIESGVSGSGLLFETAEMLGACTVTESVALTDPEVAVTVAVPAATNDSNPALLTVAIAALLVDQVADDVRFCVVASLYVPVAISCVVVPTFPIGLAGVMAIDFRLGGTVTVAVPLTCESVAVIVDFPAATAVARPEADTVATVVLENDHAEVEVTSFVEPSEYVPVAVNCWVALIAILAVTGDTPMDVRLGVETGGVEVEDEELLLPPPLQPAIIRQKATRVTHLRCLIMVMLQTQIAGTRHCSALQ